MDLLYQYNVILIVLGYKVTDESMAALFRLEIKVLSFLMVNPMTRIFCKCICPQQLPFLKSQIQCTAQEKNPQNKTQLGPVPCSTYSTQGSAEVT